MAKKKGNWKRRCGRLACLMLLAAICAIGWGYLKPIIAAEAVTVYQSYTVEEGDIQTSMSLSGSIGLRSSETFSSSSRTTVQAVYVENDQSVQAGDKLLKLQTGETLEATIDGTVTEISVVAGDAVWPQMSLVTIGDLDNLQVSMNVDEYDIDKVSVGQKCSVTVVSLGLTFETEIGHVNRVSASSGSVAYYTVSADIDAPENVLPGMQATVTIPRETSAGVNVLPMEALSFDEAGESYVLVENGAGDYDRVAVAVGLNDGMHVEICDGLEAGDVVWAPGETQEAQSAFSLLSVYKAVFGETTVINDMSGGRGGASGGGLPEGMELPEGVELPEDMELPEGMELPGDMELPEGAQLSDGLGASAASDGAASGAQDFFAGAADAGQDGASAGTAAPGDEGGLSDEE